MNEMCIVYFVSFFFVNSINSFFFVRHQTIKTMQRIHKLLSHLHSNQTHSSVDETGIFGKHDVGGTKDYRLDDLSYHSAINDERDKTLTYWERKIDALKVLLQSKKYWTIPESRTTIENLPKSSYLNIAYYEKWMYSTLMLCLKKGLFTENELLLKYHKHPQIISLKSNKDKTKKKQNKFKPGDYVKIRSVCSDEIKYESWRLYLGLIGTTHVRSPGYIINKIGIIQSYQGLFENDELKSLGINDTKVDIYKIRFKQKDIFKNKKFVNIKDTIDIDVLSHWLQRVDPNEIDHDHDHDHKHNHDQNENKPVHKDRNIVEQNAIDKEPELSPYQVISEVVIDILKEKGILI